MIWGWRYLSLLGYLTLISQPEPPELIFPVRIDTGVIENQVRTESVQQPGKVSLHCGTFDILVRVRIFFVFISLLCVHLLYSLRRRVNVPVERYSLSSSPSSRLISRSLCCLRSGKFFPQCTENVNTHGSSLKIKAVPSPCGKQTWEFYFRQNTKC